MRGRLDAQTWLFLAASVLALLILSVHAAQDVLVYNSSNSIPRGWYVRQAGSIVRGAIVTVRATDVAPDYARLQDFTRFDDRFIKRIAAADGDIVCADGPNVTINGVRTLMRATRDRAGRALPTWSGCRTLSGEVFLAGDTPDSFDGRYWGPVHIEKIEGVWRRVM